MRTLIAGVKAVRQSPLSLMPSGLEGVVGGVLFLTGAFPQTGASASSTAAFPLGVYFDVKQSLSFAPTWGWFLVTAGVGVLVRGAILAATLWLADGAKGPFAGVWAPAARLAALGAVLLIPAAGLFYTGVAVRYSPFVGAAAVLGLVPALFVTRRAVLLDAGSGRPRGRGVPELPGFLAYGYLVALMGAALSVLTVQSPVLGALLIVFVAPVHGLVFLGWRQHVRDGTYPGGGALAMIATAVALVALAGATIFDRRIRDPAPSRGSGPAGSLLVLGGVDSSSETGALADLDPRAVGFATRDVVKLSYRGLGRPYVAADTRRDLGVVARKVAAQVAAAPRPTSLIGHSQAALILDRIEARRLPMPDRSVVISSPPARPPPVDAPAAGRDGPGRPGADLARGFAFLLETVGLSAYDVDAPGAPVHVEASTAPASRPRLSIWALADSVWLTHDWRRAGETNVVAITDHVGATKNARAMNSAKRFFASEVVEDDETSWRGALVAVLRHAFGPWRPE